jgi:hypothetical protein
MCIIDNRLMLLNYFITSDINCLNHFITSNAHCTPVRPETATGI